MGGKSIDFELLLAQKQEELDAINKEFILFKEKAYNELDTVSLVFDELDQKNKEYEILKKEFEKVKNLNEELELELKKIKDREAKVNKRLNSYKNSKLGRLTTRYWIFRKKINKGGK